MEKKNKVLILFKWPWNWNKFLINKLSKFYSVEYLYLDKIKDKNFSEIVNDINKKIDKEKIEIVFFDVDYYRFINLYFVNNIKNVKKVLITGDDYELHKLNSITATSCDLVLSSCPISVEKYKEKGHNAHYMPNESDGNIFKKVDLKKDIEVIFFGRINSDRKEFFNFLNEKGISIKIVGDTNQNFVSDEELANLICRSKIVLNLSKSTWGAVRNYGSNTTHKFYYQFKGRIIIAGLCGTACVSEYSPGQDLLFSRDEVATFYNKEECLNQINKLLKEPKILEDFSNKLHLKSWNLYEDKKNFEPIYKEIEKLKLNRVNLIKIPYWYLRICAKQILLRNIEKLNLFKKMSELFNFLSSIRKSNFFEKILIFVESIINIFWYYLISFFKRS